MDYKIGKMETFSKTISENDVYLFAGITGDMNPVHINKEACSNIYGERIAHGILVAGFISNVIGMKLPGPGTIYLEQNCKFIRPVKIGDTITAVVEILEVLNQQKNIIKLRTDVTNQKSELVITGWAVVKAP
ncbi:MAG: MaoC family dehydratase [Lachnospiraceae bacterium]|nr:MaoC family dehydratase [uncultured Acetatifactor sp.]MCI8288012.1 MaoC family dehydratase [Lachnospiraceae bacterium]